MKVGEDFMDDITEKIEILDKYFRASNYLSAF